MGTALHFFVDFRIIVCAAVVIRQPYIPIFAVTVVIWDCRGVTLWQPVTPLMDTLALGKSVSPSIVELAGVEPASKQLTKVLSTCLVSC